MLNRYLIVYLVLLGSINSFCQESPGLVDSLKKELRKSLHDTVRMNVLQELVNNSSEKEYLKFNEDLEVLCKKSALNSNKRIQYLAIKNLINVNDTKAYFFRSVGDPDSAIFYCERAIKYCDQINDTSALIHIYRITGIIWEDKGESVKSLDYYHKALSLAEKTRSEKLTGRLYSSIGATNYFLNNTREGLHYLLKSLAISLKLKSTPDVGDDYNTIGSIYSDLKLLDSALYYQKKSYEVSVAMNDTVMMLANLNNIGHSFYRKRMYDSALAYYRINNRIREYGSFRTGELSTLYNNIGEAYLKKGFLDSTEYYSTKALKLEIKSGRLPVLKNIYSTLEELYYKEKKFDKAYDMLLKTTMIKDSLEGIEIRKAVTRKMLKYDFEKKQFADSLKVAEEKKVTEAQLKQEKTARYYLFGGLFLVIIFAIFMFNRFKVTQKQKRIIELKEIETHKQNIIIHEQKQKVEEKQKEILDSIRYAKRIQISLMPPHKYIENSLKKLKGNI